MRVFLSLSNSVRNAFKELYWVFLKWLIAAERNKVN